MSVYELTLMLYFMMWYFLIVLAIFFVISGADDLFIDMYYWLNYLYRLWKMRKFKPLTYQKLLENEEQWIAVLIPCWNEAGVIGTMLEHNCNNIDYHNYVLFVGVYPNDLATVDEVQRAEKSTRHVKCVISPIPGPTNKAQNLNQIYKFVKQYEKENGMEFAMFVFHDSEDIIHPRSFLVYNHLIPRKDMIQVPVFPLAVPYQHFTHWLYADEFAENHTKDIIVRESIKGHVPSAGVGTAFSRRALKMLEDPKTKEPFCTNSLTEDYRTSLILRTHQLSQIFITQKIHRIEWRRAGIFTKRRVKKKVHEYIATRAMFPMHYRASVRQKARWIIGIVFQEWRHIQWPKQWVIRYTLAHDRKSFITHFINAFGYVVFLFWVLYASMTAGNPLYPSLQEQLNQHPWVWWTVVFVTSLMLERMLQRFIAVWRVYQDWIPAFLSIPRSLYGNILNFHALCRAYRIYFGAPEAKQKAKMPSWDKTDHIFPASHILAPVHKRLGDLLIQKNKITKDDLLLAIYEQQNSGTRLGEILMAKGIVTPQVIQDVLSEQYNIPIFKRAELKPLAQYDLKALPPKLVELIKKVHLEISALDEKNKTITFAIEDPTNEYLIERIINMALPFKANFVLLEWVD